MIKIVGFILILSLLVWARKSTPAGNKNGTTFNQLSELASSKSTLNVATFNIQTGKSNEGKRDINASAQVLKNVDLAGVQEVYAPSLLNLIGVGKQQTEVLADRGGFGWLFNATRRRWLREHRGNALLSKLKPTAWETQMLPDQSGKSYRNMTIAELEWQGQTFHFINTHLHTRQGRSEQLSIVLREFAKYPRAILVGDFNSSVTMPEMIEALKDIEVTDAIHHAGLDKENTERIDWILTKGFVVHSGKMQEKGVSDHPYYEVELSYQT